MFPSKSTDWFQYDKNMDYYGVKLQLRQYITWVRVFHKIFERCSFLLLSILKSETIFFLIIY